MKLKAYKDRIDSLLKADLNEKDAVKQQVKTLIDGFKSRFTSQLCEAISNSESEAQIQSIILLNFLNKNRQMLPENGEELIKVLNENLKRDQQQTHAAAQENSTEVNELRQTQPEEIMDPSTDTNEQQSGQPAPAPETLGEAAGGAPAEGRASTFQNQIAAAAQKRAERAKRQAAQAEAQRAAEAAAQQAAEEPRTSNATEQSRRDTETGEVHSEGNKNQKNQEAASAVASTEVALAPAQAPAQEAPAQEAPAPGATASASTEAQSQRRSGLSAPPAAAPASSHNPFREMLNHVAIALAGPSPKKPGDDASEKQKAAYDKAVKNWEEKRDKLKVKLNPHFKDLNDQHVEIQSRAVVLGENGVKNAKNNQKDWAKAVKKFDSAMRGFHGYPSVQRPLALFLGALTIGLLGAAAVTAMGMNPFMASLIVPALSQVLAAAGVTAAASTVALAATAGVATLAAAAGLGTGISAISKWANQPQNAAAQKAYGGDINRSKYFKIDSKENSQGPAHPKYRAKFFEDQSRRNAIDFQELLHKNPNPAVVV